MLAGGPLGAGCRTKRFIREVAVVQEAWEWTLERWRR